MVQDNDDDVQYRILDIPDPFTVDDKFTRYIHLNSKNSVDKAALLSRYSRTTKSLIDLIQTEFQDKNRGSDFMKKLLSQYGDDSVAELASEQIGIEGLSLLAASKLTDQRIGISFLEKSTRYVPFTPEQFYVPGEIYHYGLLDEFKALAALSHKTFSFVFKEVVELSQENIPIKSCLFYDNKTQKDVPFENLSLESDIKIAEKSYERAVKDRAFDNAGYAWLLSLKTNLGFNANARSLEYLLSKCKLSPLSEINDIGYHLYDLLSPSIEPFISRVNPVITNINDLLSDITNNPFEIYKDGNNSIVSVYKHNIVNLLKTYDTFHDNLEDIKASVTSSSSNPNNKITKQNTNLVKNILSEMGLANSEGNKINLKETISKTIAVDPLAFRPNADIISFMNEQYCIDHLCTAILYENNENLLDYDEQNINNIDENLRIIDIDRTKVKAGILFDILNGNKLLEDFHNIDTTVNKTTENTLTFNDINAYWEENASIKDSTIYQDYEDKSKNTINKEQNYIINKYVQNRRNRRDRLGRAFEFIDYTFSISSSFRMMREFKRHRVGAFLYPQVVTARNSFDSFIFPPIFLKNKPLFDEYKYLIEQSFGLYNKIIKKSNDYHTAQYVLPLGVRTDYVAKMNMRALDHLLSLRTTPQALEEFRQVAQLIYQLLLVIHPNLIKLFRFVDLGSYELGRIKSEYRTQYKLNAIGEI